MLKNNCNKNISFRLPEDLRDKFQRLYPGCLSLFLRRAIELAIKDKSLFDKIFFTNLEDF